MTNEIHVRFFGPAREWAGCDDAQIEMASNATLGSVAGMLTERFPKLATIGGVRLAVNQAFVPLATVIKPGDEVAVIPPVSGG
ncbi:MAG: molybdopterin converting factor subunit 1 [Planctomycetes bacterium]|nr:molybdopterin converting factor subunit 1 [Planctomycetota bacterium]